MSRKVDKVVCAWGNKAKKEDLNFPDLGDLYCLAISKEGNPKHPLYLSKDLKPKRFFLKRNNKNE